MRGLDILVRIPGHTLNVVSRSPSSLLLLPMSRIPIRPPNVRLNEKRAVLNSHGLTLSSPPMIAVQMHRNEHVRGNISSLNCFSGYVSWIRRNGDIYFSLWKKTSKSILRLHIGPVHQIAERYTRANHEHHNSCSYLLTELGGSPCYFLNTTHWYIISILVGVHRVSVKYARSAKYDYNQVPPFKKWPTAAF